MPFSARIGSEIRSRESFLFRQHRERLNRTFADDLRCYLESRPRPAAEKRVEWYVHCRKTVNSNEKRRFERVFLARFAARCRFFVALAAQRRSPQKKGRDRDIGLSAGRWIDCASPATAVTSRRRARIRANSDTGNVLQTIRKPGCGCSYAIRQRMTVTHQRVFGSP